MEARWSSRLASCRQRPPHAPFRSRDITVAISSPRPQVVEDGYEFFARRQLVTLFSAPNYCGEFDNAGGMMAVDDSLMCSFQILKPAEKTKRFVRFIRAHIA